jgi:hypothetical protein
MNLGNLPVRPSSSHKIIYNHHGKNQREGEKNNTNTSAFRESLGVLGVNRGLIIFWHILLSVTISFGYDLREICGLYRNRFRGMSNDKADVLILAFPF